MRKIEKEEERLTFSEPDKQCYHLCIVNLVIGTQAHSNHIATNHHITTPTTT